ncbi:hypothetical protein Mapa_012066 [Marchantia paleacea]|nr:hypothetical protein Mapa_012066 [Marchantia paleacea]
MAVVVSSSQGWLGSNTVLPFLDLSWLFQAAAIQAKQEAERTAPLLEGGQLQSVGAALITESSSESVDTEESCSRGASIDSDDDICNISSRTEVQEGCCSDLDASELKRVFQKFDENQDDLICAADLRRFMSRLDFEVSEEEAVSMLATVDHDGDGKVGFEEFCTLYRSLDDGGDGAGELEDADDDEETLLEAFKVFDKNNDGFITCQELQTVLLALGLPEGQSLKSCELMIQGVDSDGNGEVDIMEFKQMMSSNIFMK